MQHSNLAYSKTNQFSRLILDYLSEKPDLNKFYGYEPKISNFEQQIELKKNTKIPRTTLQKVLVNQYKNLKINSSTQKNIDNLLLENTFTVCTGHQLNLATGPFYFISKIVSTINLSRQLNQHYPQNNFVPLFWMASEDHDFKEINHIQLFNKNLEWESQQTGPVGTFNLNGIEQILNSLQEIQGSNPITKKIVQQIIESYSEQKNLADATRYLVNELFGDYGLVIIDANEEKLKSEFKGIIVQDIIENHSARLMNETIEELRKHHTIQVKPRDINFFYVEKNIRERIVLENNVYKVLNTTIAFSKEELIEKIDKYPQNFSPNVSMRPIYQEAILPNLAYIGGPAEVAYWLELKSTFEFYSLPMPIVFLRNHALFIDPNSTKKMEKLQISKEDIFEPVDKIIQKFVIGESDKVLNLKEEIKTGEELFKGILTKAIGIDPTLKESVLGEESKFLSTLNNLEQKIVKAEKRKYETEVDQIKKLKEKLFPSGVLSERKENLLGINNSYSEEIIPYLIANFDPFNNSLYIIEA